MRVFTIGDDVIPKTSARKGQVGTVVSIGKNPSLPIAVKFDGDNFEWDFRSEELEIHCGACKKGKVNDDGFCNYCRKRPKFDAVTGEAR